MSAMPFAKQAASKGRTSIYDQVDLEEVVVNIEFYPSEDEDEQTIQTRSPSPEDSKFGILAAATTLTSLAASRHPFTFVPREQEEPRRKFNLAHLALPVHSEARAPINIFVKHEVVGAPYPTTTLVPIRFMDEASSFETPDPVQPPEPIPGPAKFTMTNPQLHYGASSLTSAIDNRLLEPGAFRTYDVDPCSSTGARPKSVSTSPSESSLPCEVSSTVTENNVGVKLEPPDELDAEEVGRAETLSSASSASSALSASPASSQLTTTTTATTIAALETLEFKCAKCPKAFGTYRGLQSHMKAHKRRFRLTSRPQDLAIYEVDDYDDPRDRNYRQRAPMPPTDGPLVTQTWTTEDVPRGSRAIKIETPVRETAAPRMFTCAECYKTFSCMRGLKIHLKSHRKRENLNAQQGSPRGAASNQRANAQPSFEDRMAVDLIRQENANDGIGDGEVAVVEAGSRAGARTFLCALCGKRFCRRNHLVFHLRIHSGEKPYNCDLCPSKFSRADSLKVHKRIHTGERPYVCDICGAAFAQMINANVHRRCHTGEKPFCCEECGARFIKKDGLTVHRRIHTGEKPYSCDECGAKFAYRSCILSHYKVHNGNLIYRCEKCNAGFSLLCNLTRHKKVHADDPPSPELPSEYK